MDQTTPSAGRKAEPTGKHLVDATMFWSVAGGGVRRYLLQKQMWLTRRKWLHTIIVPGAEGPGFTDCGGMLLPFSGGYHLPLRRALATRLIAQQQPDIIEVGDPYRLAWATLDAGQRLGVPTVAFCHINLVAQAGRLAGGHGSGARGAQRAAGSYLRHLYRNFDLVLAPSQAMVEELRELGIAHVERQPLGVDSRIFHPRRRDPAWRESLGLPRDSRLLLYAGRFAREKNLPVLVEAIERLGPHYVLLAVGHGPAPPHGRQVIVLPHEGHDSELAKIYASVDGFVHAGDQETFGLAALEAMACGTPLAVRASAGLGELIADDAGIGVSSLDPAAWVEAIARIFTEGRGARFLAARIKVESLDWHRVLPGLLQRYQRLLGDRPAAVERRSQDTAMPASRSFWRQPLSGQTPHAGADHRHS